MKIDDDADFVFYMSYDKKDVSCEVPFINAWVEEKNVKLNNYVIITDENNFDKILKDEKFSISTIDNYYEEFKKCVSKLKDER